MNGSNKSALVWSVAAVMVLCGGTLSVFGQPPAPGQPGAAKEEPPDFPPFAEVTKGFEKVVSTADGQASLYTIYRRDKDQRLLAELPRGYEKQKVFVATTIAGGQPMTGIQMGAQYAYWRRYDKRLALIQPNVEVRTTGDAESKKTEEMLFTDRVLLEVPILAMGPGGGPVIDFTGLLTGHVEQFFGGAGYGSNKGLVKIVKAKAFPKNLEIALEMPARGGTLTTFHYSWSEIPDKGSYQPRLADPRVGFFTTAYRDISKQDKDTQWVRYINRWNLEKRDPKLKLSPPKEPIVYYIDASTPVQYRRWVREGILDWNKAFEKVGIDGAIEVYQQDAQTNQHMDKDPEDVRYNFVRWTSADLGFAIGPSRVHPETGQILNACVVIDDGFIRGWVRTYQQLLPEVAMLGYGPEVMAWLDANPQWDPRVRLADPSERDVLIQQRQIAKARAMSAAVKADERAERNGAMPLMGLRGGEPLMFQSIVPGAGTTAGYGASDMYSLRCAANLGKSLDVALMRVGMESLGLIALEEAKKGDDPPEAGKDSGKDGKDAKDGKKKEEPKEQLLDGLPESFVGPLLKDLVNHEVGHTMGLRHNFKASSIATIKEINSEDFKGKKAFTGSVMDYNPININFKDGAVQGDFAMIGPGPYDFWAIEYGYTSGDLKPILARVSENDLPYGTDEDISGPDPLIKQFDLGRDSLDYAESRVRLSKFLKTKIIEKIVKDGDSWQKARDSYSLLLGQQIQSVRIAGYYLGGASVNRDRKGDPGNRDPVTPFDMKQQRRALKFIIDNTFQDESFGLTRELLAKLTVDKWYDGGGYGTLFQDPAWPIHDRILGIQASALTMMLNPTTLQRVYDNEFRLAPDQDCLTLPEMIDTITAAVWTELDGKSGRFSAREPMISSLRRNLQREYLSRLIDLATNDAAFGAAYKPISNLVVAKLRDLKANKIDSVKDSSGLDPYTRAHLSEASIRIAKALDAQVIYNAKEMGGGGGIIIIMGGEPQAKDNGMTPHD